MRVLVNYMLRKETWFVHAISEDALTSISPSLPVLDQATLIRLLRYVGAGDSEIEEVNVDIGRWPPFLFARAAHESSSSSPRLGAIASYPAVSDSLSILRRTMVRERQGGAQVAQFSRQRAN